MLCPGRKRPECCEHGPILLCMGLFSQFVSGLFDSDPPALAQADVRACLAASKAASRSVNFPFANPARAIMVGMGSVSKK
jgi:hypothetical protein